MHNGNIALPLAKARQRELLEQAAHTRTPRRFDRRIAKTSDEKRDDRGRFAVLRMAGGAGKGSLGA